jgi:hypothetical protein
MRVRVCFHNQCFDGACSAAIFSRFYRECVNPQAQLDYTGMMHRAGQLFDSDVFDGDENAIVDFKYSSSPRLTWWFDHHQSAFLTEADAEHFRRDNSGKKFYDPGFYSCTKFIAHIGATKFNFHPADLQELIQWADVVDGALYSDPKTAVEMRDPATQLTLVIEGARSKDFVPRLIPELASKSLAEVAALPEIRKSFEELFAKHLKSIDVVRASARLEGGVIFLDSADQEEQQTFNKFIPYYLFPGAVYSVAVSRSRERTKIGVGSNPWNPTPKTANLATICERYGGGGHAKVAAISLPPDALDRAREVARQITAELQASLEKQ